MPASEPIHAVWAFVSAGHCSAQVGSAPVEKSRIVCCARVRGRTGKRRRIVAKREPAERLVKPVERKDGIAGEGRALHDQVLSSRVIVYGNEKQ